MKVLLWESTPWVFAAESILSTEGGHFPWSALLSSEKLLARCCFIVVTNHLLSCLPYVRRAHMSTNSCFIPSWGKQHRNGWLSLCQFSWWPYNPTIHVISLSWCLLVNSWLVNCCSLFYVCLIIYLFSQFQSLWLEWNKTFLYVHGHWLSNVMRKYVTVCQLLQLHILVQSVKYYNCIYQQIELNDFWLKERSLNDYWLWLHCVRNCILYSVNFLQW
jgi:hypothetical protein